MTSKPEPADAHLLAAHDLARAALREVTPASTIGDPAGYTLEEGGAVSLRFANTMPGYPGWFWTVSLDRVEGEDPTVLEVELLPGDDALLAPDWVPWAVRLADYQAAQTALAEAADASGDDARSLDDFDDDDDDDDDLDDDDLDDDPAGRLHAGDVDGVDIDELDDAFDDDAPDDDDGGDAADGDDEGDLDEVDRSY